MPTENSGHFLEIVFFIKNYVFVLLKNLENSKSYFDKGFKRKSLIIKVCFLLCKIGLLSSSDSETSGNVINGICWRSAYDSTCVVSGNKLPNRTIFSYVNKYWRV